jgi:hypothetical protein
MEKLIPNLREIDARFKQNLNVLQNGLAESIKLQKAKKLRAISNFIEPSKVHFFVDPKFTKATAGWQDVTYLPENLFDIAEQITSLGTIDHNTVFLLSSTLPQRGNIQSLINFLRFGLTTNAPIILWDWDNHHHLFISTILSLASDVYFYSHTSNEYEITNFCDYSFHLPVASFQWEKQFLEENFSLVARKQRSNETLGNFVNYALFQTRNRTIERLAQQIKGVGFVDSGKYFEMSAIERFEHWTGHKTHFVIPTLDDVPIRIFDALVSGGVVILPQRFATKRFLDSLEANDFELYDQQDLHEPERLIERANEKFNKEGVGGALRRASNALRNDIGDCRLSEIKKIFYNTIDSLKIK